MNKELEELKKMILFASNLTPEEPTFASVRESLNHKYNQILYQNSVSSRKVDEELALKELEKSLESCIEIDLVDVMATGVFVFFKNWPWWKNDIGKLGVLVNQEV